MPIVTILALAVQSIGTYASAGIQTVVTCCCPDPDTCRCHDHKSPERPSESMKRCAGAVDVATPIVQATTLPAPTPIPTPMVRTALVTWMPSATPSDRSYVPEKPPF